MTLEQRLRSELERTAKSTSVNAARPVGELAAVANSRRKRNRLVGVGGALSVCAALWLSTLVFAQPEESVLDVASGVVESMADGSSADVAPESPGEDVDGEVAPEQGDGDAELEAAEADAQLDSVDSGGDSVGGTLFTSDAARLEGVSRSLQVDDAPVAIETRNSAVALAAGSGVLVVASDGGYAGLATRLGSDASAIGISSDNGLDWTEVELSGIPAGATASQLAEFEGTFVALFESFDSQAGVRSTFVGTSTDMASWEVSGALSGQPFATGLAIGEAGVVVIGDNEAPDVWAGPIGGPYERTARLNATAVSGVTTIDDEFVVAGRSSEGATVFRSDDGIEWTGTALTSPVLAGSTPIVSIDGGAIILSTANAGASVISVDGGDTWSQVDVSAQSVAVHSNTFSLLSSIDGQPVISIGDDESFAGVEVDVEDGSRLALIAAGDDEVVMLQALESGATWIVAAR